MPEPEKIAVINVGWSRDYEGTAIAGQHGYLLKGNSGHERFNLLPAPNGHFYLYVPPIGTRYPNPKYTDDWLVFMVSKRHSQPGLVVVAWFEHANFVVGEPLRPDWRNLYARTGIKYPYSIEASEAFIVPEPVRSFTFKGSSVKRPYAYLRGGRHDAWREELAQKLLDYRNTMQQAVASQASNDFTKATGGFCVDPQRRQKVERAAIDEVKKYFGPSYQVRDRQKDSCGYDLEFMNCRTGEKVCVEVKGTDQQEPHFIISSNEYLTGKRMANASSGASTNWKIAVVCNVMTSPQVRLYDFHQMRNAFQLKTLAWHATKR